jgi:drug/metabolite transporter (DMT)-like permease
MQKAGLVLLSGLLYSITIACVNAANRSMPPLTLTAVRLTVASLVFASLLLVAKPRFNSEPRRLLDIGLIGLLNVGLPFVILAISLHYISTLLAAVLFNISVPMTLVLAHFLLPDEKLTLGKVAGCAAALAGAAVLIGSNASGLSATPTDGWIGQALILFASLAGAVAIIYARRRMRETPTLVLSAGQIFVNVPLVLLMMLVFEGRPVLAAYPPQALMAAAGAAIVGPVIAFWLLFYMIKRFSASLGGYSGIATPLFSAVIGVLLLGEVISLPMAAGSALLLAGVWSLHQL